MRCLVGVLLAVAAGCGAAPAPFEGRLSALFFVSVECPASNREDARRGALAREFPAVSFFAVYSNDHEGSAEVADHARRSEFPGQVLKDDGQVLADRFEVETTPTVCLIDASGRLRYKGRIDELPAALEAVQAGREVAVASTPASGCRLKRAPKAAAAGEVTYAKDVAPILNRHCVSCHRPGQVGPMSLAGYRQARAWAPEIKEYVSGRRMPPWKPVSREVAYLSERGLSGAEIATLGRWADLGAPEGDPRELPPTPAFPADWELGPPDAVLEPPAEFEVEASGPDEYRAFVIPTSFGEDRWVSAVEFRPGNPRIVHHIMTYIDMAGFGRRRDAENPDLGFESRGTGPGFFPAGDLGGHGPGTQPCVLPPGTARLLPQGADIVMEVHYHKSGRKEKDRTRIGLHFAKEPVKKKVRSSVVLDMKFEIPAGAERHTVTTVWAVPEDLHAIAVIPHMHLIGREIDVSAYAKDGTKRTLVRIDDWDFNWQEAYFFREPFALPRGTRVVVTSWFDNSAANPRNPNRPPVPVRFGLNTTDEMSVAYIAFTRDAEDLTRRD
jgi:mono/diheme cytochrome c family protein